jgi:hypothetical protein
MRTSYFEQEGHVRNALVILAALFSERIGDFNDCNSRNFVSLFFQAQVNN